MKFLNLGLFTVSSLFAATSAAPAYGATSAAPASYAATSAAPVSYATTVPTLPGNDKAPSTELNSSSDSVVCSKLKTVIVEVKKHTSTINATIVSIDMNISKADKTSIIKLVQSEVTIIVGLIGTLTGEILGLVGETLEKVEQEKLLSLVLELIFEIVFTLKNVIAVLKICKLQTDTTPWSALPQ